MSGNFHGAPSGVSQDPLYDTNAPTPSHAERARTLAQHLRSGTLSTLCLDPLGHPYGSLVTTALFEGSPILLVSELAEHTRNLRADARASLMLAEGGADSPLALGRITLLGNCALLDAEAHAARDAYLDAHPDAKYYVDYGDFHFWRLDVQALRYIGGFGRMSWVKAEDWYAATSDPLASSATRILEHMNADHKGAMGDCCRAFSRAQEFSDVVMTGVDRYGFEMSVQTKDGWRPVRLAFAKVVATADEARREMVALAKRARERVS